ncbi:hypothetical protein G6Z94_11755 [Vibrio aestuarianus]|uniref:hypothetical protein n=1 Tax=Vibrio aestuarianus TaxID=28171 RepID=UPI001592EBFA|nr:hypothetical protein [Vibrio aestuarianus]NGZ18014.1 hypothetical protein [Vibrio aestuarianus]
MSTLVSALANETVTALLYRILGDDTDELVEAFYELNPTQTTLFLEPLQQVLIPEKKTPTKPEVEPVHILEVWE